MTTSTSSPVPLISTLAPPMRLPKASPSLPTPSLSPRPSPEPPSKSSVPPPAAFSTRKTNSVPRVPSLSKPPQRSAPISRFSAATSLAPMAHSSTSAKPSPETFPSRATSSWPTTPSSVSLPPQADSNSTIKPPTNSTSSMPLLVSAPLRPQKPSKSSGPSPAPLSTPPPPSVPAAPSSGKEQLPEPLSGFLPSKEQVSRIVTPPQAKSSGMTPSTSFPVPPISIRDPRSPVRASPSPPASSPSPAPSRGLLWRSTALPTVASCMPRMNCGLRELWSSKEPRHSAVLSRSPKDRLLIAVLFQRTSTMERLPKMILVQILFLQMN